MKFFSLITLIIAAIVTISMVNGQVCPDCPNECDCAPWNECICSNLP